MRFHLRPVLAVSPALLLAAAGAWAQTAPQAAAKPAAAAASAPATIVQRPAGADKADGSDKRVLEDDKVRIEETRLRGQTQNVTVHSKLPGVRSYEVIMPPLGKDPSQDKGAAGKRTWSLFDF